MRRLAGAFACAALALATASHAMAPCAATLAQLRALLADDALPLEWRETSMDDGKPLVLSILEKDGALFLAFVKTGEGLWVEGASVVCGNGRELEARFLADRVHVGEAAGWQVRWAFENGSQFTLLRSGAEELRIATAGWTGTFSGRRR